LYRVAQTKQLISGDQWRRSLFYLNLIDQSFDFNNFVREGVFELSHWQRKRVYNIKLRLEAKNHF
jgi:hypothetical protein